jgi:hypothetical protein
MISCEPIWQDVKTEKAPDPRQGDLWTLGSHRLLCGDATAAAHWRRLMDGQQADMVLTSALERSSTGILVL